MRDLQSGVFKAYHIEVKVVALVMVVFPYFALDARAQATPPGPMTWTFGYDAEGNPKTITNPNGGVTQHTYDSLNRRRTTTQPLPATGVPRPVILMDYDGRDQLSRVQDPRNLATTYTTDGLGNVTSIQSPDSGVTTFTHDAAGNPITRTDARGVTHTYTYDDLNRLTRIDYPTGTATVYEYDGGPGGVVGLIGRLTKITDESGSTTYGYNGFGDVTSKTQVVNSAAGSRTFMVTTTIGETGIVTGKPTRITYPSGAHVDIGYEYAGRPGSITVTRNGSATVLLSGVTYNALHALSGWTWGDGTPYQRTFDSFLRLSTYPLGNPNGTGAAMGLTRTLSYDNAGNVTGYLHSGQPGFDQGHSYDGLDRLVQTLKSNSRYGYRYDATGNRVSREIGADSYTHMVEAASNRLFSVQEPSGSGAATRTYSYDAMGNLTSDGINTFVYSARGRMSRADTPNGSVSYLVNGKEQRVSKTGLTVPTGAAYYVYDEEGHTIGEYDVDGNALYEVIYLRGTPVGVITPASISYIYADHINTPRMIVRNSDHAVVWRWDEAEAFGATPPDEDPNGLGAMTFNQRFPGQVFDRETGLFYNWHRDYSSSTGRYVQSDPIGFNGGINTYAYVNGNPNSYVDPSGLICVTGVTTTTCVNPNGPTFSVPAQPGYPPYIGPDQEMPGYHIYDVQRSIGCANPSDVMQGIINNPTPGTPNPATPGGTPNNAVVLGMDNIVTSYVTTDLVTGSPLVVNITGPESLFGPGYVARYVKDGVAHTMGEGANGKQSPDITGRLVQYIANEALWGRQMSKIISACECKR